MAKNGNVAGEAQQTPQGKHVRSRSHYNELSHSLYHTDRFGEYTVDLLLDGVPTDSFDVNSVDHERSYTLGQPLMNPIHKRKEYFMVPKQSLLPLNWDKIFTNPTQGDDVPRDANTVLLGFAQNFVTFWARSFAQLSSVSVEGAGPQASAYLTAFMRCLILGEYVYSSGSLLNVMGCKYSRQFIHSKFPGTGSAAYDLFFDACVSELFAPISFFTVTVNTSPSNTKEYYFRGLMQNDNYTYRDGVSSLRSFISLMRENPSARITSYVLDSASTNVGDLNSIITGVFAKYVGTGVWGSTWRSFFGFILPSSASVDTNTGENEVEPSDGTIDSFTMNGSDVNVGPLLAYQIICAHYYSRDNVDIVYSSELFRQIFSAYYTQAYASGNDGSQVNFVWNGVKLPYDFLSGKYLARLLYYGTNDTISYLSYNELSGTGSQLSIARLSVYALIFGFRRSLRYLDYFTGARVSPLAVGNTDIQVNNNAVSVVDTTRNIMKQRFLNAVNRTGRKLDDYTKGLFGVKPKQDYHNPLWLAVTQDVINSQEVENTGEAQQTQKNSITSNLRGSGRYRLSFDVDNGYPCYILRLVSYDIRRAYTRTVQRHFLHVDRFDMFNPDFQFIGDQPILGIELGQADSFGFGANPPTVTPSGSMPGTFGFQTRNEEFKTRFDEASGGFVSALRPWIFSDYTDMRLTDVSINSDFIRSWQTELDQYFVSLTGYSLGTYFHFICKTDNIISASRPMVKTPNIL